MKKTNLILQILLTVLIIPITFVNCSSSDTEDEPIKPNPNPIIVDKWDDAADKGMVSLLRFWKADGQYFTEGVEGSKDQFPYWYEPHGLDVIIDAYERKNTEATKAIYKDYMLKWYAGVKAKNVSHNGGLNFDNFFYDDMEWVALALLRGYQNIGDPAFLESAKFLWKEIKKGWDDQLNGGIYWTTGPYGDNLDTKSKNACSNGPASLLALKMYDITKDDSDKEWAMKIYKWTRNYLYNSSTGGVYDNIKVAPSSEYGKVDVVTLSYNQGTFLASALGLYKITGEKKYLDEAIKGANHTINTQIYTDTKLLRDEGGGGNALFRGIFIRYFVDLILEEDLDRDIRTTYLSAIDLYATSLLTKGAKLDEKGGYMYGRYWDKVTADYNLSQQLTGCMLIEARAKLKRLGYFED